MDRNKAIEVVKSHYPANKQILNEALETLIPELKESEDEKIRKQILSFLKEFECDHYRNLDFSSWIAWLEKQGEKCTIVWHSISEEPDEQEELLCEWESEDATWHDIAFYHADTKTFWDGEIQVENVTRWCYINDLLKNQGKQKTTDVELRFKVGDWVVNKYGYVWHVDSFDKKNCQVSNGEGDDCYFKISKQDEFHLWTIDDAKDGDVIVCDSKYGQQIGIVKRYVGKIGGCDICFKTYCFVDWEGNFWVGEHIGSRDIHPATKEQRVLLFQKMKEAGYEWDYIDKKVLKID